MLMELKGFILQILWFEYTIIEIQNIEFNYFES